MSTNTETLANKIADFIRQSDDEHEDLYHALEVSFREEVLKQELPEDDYSFMELNLADEILELIESSNCSALSNWLGDLSEWVFDKDRDSMLFTEDEIIDISRDAGNLHYLLTSALSA